MQLSYQTQFGACYEGTAEEVLASPVGRGYLGAIDLVFTSPPFPLTRKKSYGNLQGQAYVDWLAGFAPLFRSLLTPSGSIVLEVGNAWEPGRPVMSTLAIEALLAFRSAGAFSLCQQFIWNNPARLPSPAQWVTVERARVKDAFTHIWWLSTSDRPKADNRRVLRPYSDAMQRLLRRQTYNSGRRPSQHTVGATSFLADNHGAIPSNVITVANTESNSQYLRTCKEHHLLRHPARMPLQVAEFFVQFLTEEGDTVLDPFAGSNTTGAAAEMHRRRWVAIDADGVYAQGSRGRFPLAADIPS